MRRYYSLLPPQKCRTVIFTKENIKIDHLLKYVFLELDELTEISMEDFLDANPVYADLVESMTDACLKEKFTQKMQVLKWLEDSNSKFKPHFKLHTQKS